MHYPEEEIDYLHPDGKPEDVKKQEPTEGESARPDAKAIELALHEADGHSMRKPDPFLDEEAPQS